MKKLLILVGLLLLMVLGWFFGLPAYRAWKEQHVLTMARELFDKPNPTTADETNLVLCIRQVLAIDPGSVEACCIMARVSEKIHSPHAIDWWQKVVNFDPRITSNRLALARAALMVGNYQRADLALTGITTNNQDTATYHQLAAMVAVAGNNLAKADWHFTRAAQLDPQNKAIQFDVSVLHLQAKNLDTAAAAKKTMEALTADPQYRKDALRHLALAAVHDKDFVRAETFVRELQTGTNTAFEDRILNLSILKQSDSPDFSARLEQLKTDVALNPDQINTLVSWLAAHEMCDDALKWLTSLPQNLQTQPAILMARSDTLMAMKDWDGLENFLREQNWGAYDFIRLAQIARAERGQHKPLDAANDWQSAVTAAGDRLNALATLARLATTWHFENEQEELLWNIIQRFPGERWALQSLNELYIASGNTRGLQRIYNTLLDYDPADFKSKNNLATILLLLNTELSRAHQLAAEGYAAHPTNPAFAATYAYSLHLQGRTAAGLKLLAQLRPAQLEDPGVAVYYGVLLAVSGDKVKAEKYLDLAAKGELLPEEKKLIQNARGN